MNIEFNIKLKQDDIILYVNGETFGINCDLSTVGIKKLKNYYSNTQNGRLTNEQNSN